MPLRVVCLTWVLLTAVCALGSSPVRADETARLENLLLIEQLVDVSTTQVAVHTTQCSQYVPITGALGAPVLGAAHVCIGGQEGDPLARPFVATPYANGAAALVLNSFVRLAMRNRNPRALRFAVVLYPLAIGRTLTTEYDNARAVHAIGPHEATHS